ncbi:MAG: phosphatase PAP2 family protein [bacterium]|nr:phosphatase PAP2 family protein [bacterium]
MALDTSLFYLLNNLAGQSSLLDGVIVFFASYLAYILGALFFALVFFSAYSKREKWELLLVVGISSVVARFGVTELIRFFYHRPRPFLDLPVHQLLTSTEWSFPSGHATFFFAVATAVYLHNKKWGIGFFIATVLMTVSRVAAGIHYPSDIIVGAFIGIVVAYATFYGARRVIPKNDDNRV